MQSLQNINVASSNLYCVQDRPRERSSPGGQSKTEAQLCSQSPTLPASSLVFGPAMQLGRFSVRTILNFNPTTDPKLCSPVAASDHPNPGLAPNSGTYSIFSKFFSVPVVKPIQKKNLGKKLKVKKPSKQRNTLDGNCPLSRPAKQRGIKQFLSQCNGPMGDGAAGQDLMWLVNGLVWWILSPQCFSYVCV